ncbi:MAG: hypothetical protein ACLUOF_10640 [Ruminococcus sp.]
MVQFIRLRRPYQLLLAIGILASLLIHVGDPHTRSGSTPSVCLNW